MKYIKYTYVDAITGVSVASHPAVNGPVMPAVNGLAFAWARESRYPTEVPEFFGTCADDANTRIDGVLGVYEQADWEQMRSDELAARNPVPSSVAMRQARLALLGAGLLDNVEDALAKIPDDMQRRAAQIEWEYAQSVSRNSPWVLELSQALGLSSDNLDELFRAASRL